MKRFWLFLLLAGVALLTACGKKAEEQEQTELGEHEIWIYYANLEKNGLVSRACELDEQIGLQQQVEALVERLSNVEQGEEYQSPIPSGITFLQNDVERKQGKIELQFQVAYDQVDSEGMLFFKACVAKTLLQLPGVNMVTITLNDVARPDSDTAVITENYDEESFNLFYGDANGYSQKGTIVIYFANEEGSALKEYHKLVEIANNSSLARIVVESVLAGPMQEGYLATVPENTAIQNISVKDGICYIDFSDEFYSTDNPLKNDIIVYSIVNSLCELPTVTKVQFLKNGERLPFYRETMPFDGIFERNLDLVEQEEG